MALTGCRFLPHSIWCGEIYPPQRISQVTVQRKVNFLCHWRVGLLTFLQCLLLRQRDCGDVNSLLRMVCVGLSNWLVAHIINTGLSGKKIFLYFCQVRFWGGWGCFSFISILTNSQGPPTLPSPSNVKKHAIVLASIGKLFLCPHFALHSYTECQWNVLPRSLPYVLYFVRKKYSGISEYQLIDFLF